MPAEDFAETNRIVLDNFDGFSTMSPEDWADEYGSAKKQLVVEYLRR